MTKSKEDAFVELFKSSLDYISKTNDLDIKIIENDIKILQQEIEFKKMEEPLKLFKNAHKKWEEELETLHLELSNTYKKLNEEVRYQIEFNRKLLEN